RHLKQRDDGTWLIMRCEKHMPADNRKTYAEVKTGLHEELYELKLAQKVADTFKVLREQAAPRTFLTAQNRQNDLDMQLRQEVSGGPNGPPSTATSGNFKN